MSQGHQEKKNSKRNPCRGAEGRPGGLDGMVEGGEFPYKENQFILHGKRRKCRHSESSEGLRCLIMAEYLPHMCEV